MTHEPKIFVAFAGTHLIARGMLDDVVRRSKDRLDRGEEKRIALFDDETGRPVDIDYSGSVAEVVARLGANPVAARPMSAGPMSARPGAAPGKRRGPGRPKLGVVSREISLLPRHWSWLAEQRGGASVTLRKLVDAARKGNPAQAQSRKAIDAAHRFMWDMAGDQPGFEEASRSLFARNFDSFGQQIADWPAGIRGQLERYINRARSIELPEPPEHPEPRNH